MNIKVFNILHLAAMITRLLLSKLSERLFKGKAIVLLGASQTGKSTLVRTLLESYPQKSVWLNADNEPIRQSLEVQNVEVLRGLLGSASIVVIDEAQRVRNIGLTAKIIIDELPDKQLILTGSSALELANEINEPLTGRKWQYSLYPICWQELSDFFQAPAALLQLPQRLIYGMYPEVVMHPGEEIERLSDLVESYLYKDILSFGKVRKPQLLRKLLQALAFQIGNEVSTNELAQLAEIDKNTVETYIDLLEKAFVVFRLQALSRNSRNEISSTRKVYFYDTGIRNALINNFNAIELRNDVGALWENFVIAERLKRNHYAAYRTNTYFWRSKTQQEIDLVEDVNGHLMAFEFKWKQHKTPKLPSVFEANYPDATFQVISQTNFMPFLLNEQNR